MRPKLYLETTIPSYLTAWPSRDLIRAGHQQITREWWETRRHHFELYASQLVLDEASAGDREAARDRLESLRNIVLLAVTDEVFAVASALVQGLCLPVKAQTDAAHIAIAAVNAMHFLLTWNCTHIANAEMSDRIHEICRQNGYESPVICTPEQLMGTS